MKRTAVVLVALLSSFLTGIAAEPPAVVSPESRAEAFARAFLDGRSEDLDGAMAAEMRAQFTPAIAKSTRDSLVSVHGRPTAIAPAWLETTAGGYRRFRVPVDFPGSRLDFLVVFDASDKVSGFFVDARKAPPAKRSEDAKEVPPRPDVAGRWEGTVEVPGAPLGLVVILELAGGGWSGTADIPMQGAKGIRLESIDVAGDRVAFGLAGIPGNPVFEGRLSDGKIRGTLRQSGMEFPFTLGREATAAPNRPQEPRPPFPYEEHDVRYTSGDRVRAGTLTVPAGEGPFPAVLLLSGSGAQNRDEEIFGHRPFRLLADRLAREKVAVLRVDDRGVGGSSGSLAEATIEDLVTEALDGVRWLRARPGIDPARVGLLGHSEGGLVAPAAAARSSEVAFVVMLAGPGKRGDEILSRQSEALLLAVGAPADRVAEATREHRKLLRLVEGNAPAEKLREQARRLVTAQFRAAEKEAPSPQEVESAATSALAALATPWFKSFLAFDPKAALAKVRVPVLALWGTLDLQVDAALNEAAVRKALGGAKNEDVTLRILPGLNHLFQHARTGSVEEYGAIEETMSPEVLEIVGSWVAERTRR